MPAPQTPSRNALTGVAYGLAAYGAWGVFPLFWRELRHVPALELLAHRITWALVAFLVLLTARRRRPPAAPLAVVARGKTLVTLAASATLLAVNWYTFVYAVETERVLHASIGYFLNPLLSMALGVLFLRERLRPLQGVAILLAAIGVALLGSQADGFPWIGLILAFAFGFYGLLRKTVAVDALPGSTFEAALLAPLAIAYMMHLEAGGTGHLRSDPKTTILILCTGLVTAFPLLWFTEAARRVRLVTMGFMQYVAPTGQLLIATLVFGEAFTPLHLRSFVLIWSAIAVFTVDAWRAARTGPAPG